MNTKALRQKILDLAIRGKLVPQDPNDEPASVLLQRIRAEKEQLIKEGKIKRPKKTTSSDTTQQENVPFEVPSSWEWTTLGELFTLQAGKNITASEISSMPNDIQKFKCYGGNGIRGYVNRCNRNGHYPIIGRQGALCGNINVATGDFYATEHAVVVETYAKTDIIWSVYALKQLNLNQYATATAQPGLSVAVIDYVQIPLPPLAEQKRIVAEVEKWFALIDEIEKGQTDLATLIEQTKNKVLNLAIHGKLVPQDPADEPAINLLRRINPNFQPCDTSHNENLPQGWCECSLNDISTIIMGQSPESSTYNFEDGMEFHQGKTYFTDNVIGTSGVYTTDARKIAPPNCSILCVRAPVGIVNTTDREISIGRGLCALVPLDKIENIFLFFWLKSLTSSFISKATGSTFKAISVDTVKAEKIALPPLKEQGRIVAKIEEIFSALDSIAQSLAD